MDLDNEELKETRRMNGSDKNVGSIEKLIEELTKVRPDELSKDGLKLFEYINEIIDRNQKLKEENKRLFKEIDYTSVYLKATFDEREKWKSKIKEKIKELDKLGKYNLKGLKGADRYFVKQTYNSARNSLEGLLKGE